MQKAKKTIYFYVGIAALILMAAMLIFQVINYNYTIQAYVNAGYEVDYVKETLPFWGTLMPEFSGIITSYALLAVIAFGINSLLNAIKNERYIVEDFDAEDFIESIIDDDDDDDRKQHRRTVKEEVKEENK